MTIEIGDNLFWAIFWASLFITIKVNITRNK